MESTRMTIGSKLRLASAVVVGTAALVFGGGKLYSLQSRISEMPTNEIIVNVDRLPKSSIGHNIPEKFLEHEAAGGYSRLKKKQETEAASLIVDSSYDSGIAPFELMLPVLELNAN